MEKKFSLRQKKEKKKKREVKKVKQKHPHNYIQTPNSCKVFSHHN